MSEEIEADVAFEYSAIRKEIERKINERISDKGYGDAVREWAFIAILFKSDLPAYREIQKYRRARKELEFRLKIGHTEFKEGTASQKRALILQALIRSLQLAAGMNIKNFTHEELLRDVLNVAREEGWLEIS